MTIKPVPSGPTPRPGARRPVDQAPAADPRTDEKVRGTSREDSAVTDNVELSAAARELQAGTGDVPSGELSAERLGQVVERLAKGEYEEEAVKDEVVDRLKSDL